MANEIETISGNKLEDLRVHQGKINKATGTPGYFKIPDAIKKIIKNWGGPTSPIYYPRPDQASITKHKNGSLTFSIHFPSEIIGGENNE